jgi:hypothetical protein
MTTLPSNAKVFIGAVVASGLVLFGKAMLSSNHVHDYPRFVVYLLVAMIAARCRVSLPKMTGSMAVNLPFILVALIELSLSDALIVAAASTFVQCFWPESKKRNMVQVVFNVAVLVISAQLTWWAMQAGGQQNAVLAIAAGAATILLANTMPVAAIIAFTEKAKITRTWSSILQLTFPYYLLAAGIAGLVRLANHSMGWQMPLCILPMMFLVYRSYTAYFHQMRESAEMQRAMGARAGA